MALDLTTLFDRVDRKRRQLFSYRPLPAAVIARVKYDQDLDWFRTSHAWDGGTLDAAGIESLLDTGIAVAGHAVSEHLEVQNLAEALDWVEGWAKANQALRMRDIVHLHALLHTGIPGASPGRYRTCDLQLDGLRSGRVPASAIPRHLQSLCTRANIRKNRPHPIARAVDAMASLAVLMPFREGNDPVARLVLNALLLQQGYPIAVFSDVGRLRDCLATVHDGTVRPLTTCVAETVEAGLDRYLTALA